MKTNLRKLIPKGVLPSRKKLAKLSASIDVRECHDATRSEKAIHKATAGSWHKVVKLVHSAASL